MYLCIDIFLHFNMVYSGVPHMTNAIITHPLANVISHR